MTRASRLRDERIGDSVLCPFVHVEPQIANVCVVAKRDGTEMLVRGIDQLRGRLPDQFQGRPSHPGGIDRRLMQDGDSRQWPVAGHKNRLALASELTQQSPPTHASQLFGTINHKQSAGRQFARVPPSTGVGISPVCPAPDPAIDPAADRQWRRSGDLGRGRRLVRQTETGPDDLAVLPTKMRDQRFEQGALAAAVGTRDLATEPSAAAVFRQ